MDFNSVLIISDCHLCAANCQIDILINVLEKHKSNIELLVINGDLFDSLDKRIPKKHWKFLNLIRKLSDDIDIYWVLGNHDKPHPEIIASILGITAVDHFQFRSGGNTFFVFTEMSLTILSRKINSSHGLPINSINFYNI